MIRKKKQIFKTLTVKHLIYKVKFKKIISILKKTIINRIIIVLNRKIRMKMKNNINIFIFWKNKKMTNLMIK